MSSPVCGRCGLKAVRRALERRGILLRFCDYCYWGELETEDAQVGAPAPEPEPVTPAQSQEGR